jgi:hypothetical protein
VLLEKDAIDSQLALDAQAGSDDAVLELKSRWQMMLFKEANFALRMSPKGSPVISLEDMESESGLAFFMALKGFNTVREDGSPNVFGPYLKMVVRHHLRAITWRDGGPVKVNRPEQVELLRMHFSHACERTSAPSLHPSSVGFDAFAGHHPHRLSRTFGETLQAEKNSSDNRSVDMLRVMAACDPQLNDCLERMRNGMPLRASQRAMLKARYSGIGALAQSWCIG